jgi:3-phosphoglycerate kinase
MILPVLHWLLTLYLTSCFLKNSKDLYISSFNMPHGNINDINKLSESITIVNNGKPNHIIPVIIISWSDNPGMFVDDFTSVALVANTISNKLFSLVGVSCTWVSRQ